MGKGKKRREKKATASNSNVNKPGNDCTKPSKQNDNFTCKKDSESEHESSSVPPIKDIEDSNISITSKSTLETDKYFGKNQGNKDQIDEQENCKIQKLEEKEFKNEKTKSEKARISTKHDRSNENISQDYKCENYKEDKYDTKTTPETWDSVWEGKEYNSRQDSDKQTHEKSTVNRNDRMKQSTSDEQNSTNKKFNTSKDCKSKNWATDSKYDVKFSSEGNNRQDYAYQTQHHGKSNSKWNYGKEENMSDEQGTRRKHFDVFYRDNTNKSNYAKDKSFNDIGYNEFKKKWMNNEEMNFKVVDEKFGDLFTAGPEYSLGHCVAEDMAMGSGIAVMFRRDFKRVDELLNQRKTQGEVAILEDKQRFIYYLVTKRISSGKPTYFTLWSSLLEMRKHIQLHEVKKIALPRIGCGLDGLEWKFVKKMLEYIFQNDGIEVVIYNFQQGAEDVPPPKLNKCPVFNVSYPISKIEKGTIIVYFGSEDGHITEELKTIAETFPFVLNLYRTDRKERGKFIFTNRVNDGFAFYGCIVRKAYTDPIDFTYFQKCLGAIQKRNRNEKYEYIAFQAFMENDYDNGLTVTKIINLMRHSMTYVHVYVCWPENLQHLMPRI